MPQWLKVTERKEAKTHKDTKFIGYTQLQLQNTESLLVSFQSTFK